MTVFRSDTSRTFSHNASHNARGIERVKGGGSESKFPEINLTIKRQAVIKNYDSINTGLQLAITHK